MINVWHSWYLQNALVSALLVGAWGLVRAAHRRAVWRAAFARVMRRGLVRASFAVLCAYTLVALLDSVGFHPPLRDASGAVLRHPETGRMQMDPDGMSVLDAVLTPIRTAREKTYSAPLAARQFTHERSRDASGAVVLERPPLRYPRRHLLGTDRVGQDVLYLALKGVRTGMIIGAFTTLLIIPLAMLFGILAGYRGGWVDDAIQYVYTVLSSIPPVLLIAAFMVIMGQGLLQLCVIMGVTSWTGLCRVLRGETLRLREMEYVQAARATGVPDRTVMLHHIAPNVMHVVLITAVLGFSGRVLAEAVLTYIGIGVGIDTISWGVMINDALRELARAPVIWWKLGASFLFMLGLVLPANLFGDALRDALDPRLRTE
jgi:peptide/nickel transport system permease protein